ncbi:hypothetical protein CARUB_v10015057mg [Capsella rubella]|uniref:Uncharacterized protein n=1 Tax=Capsella rubella TaxID=81985 RepID=R0I611_9BRAS|nr:hypothetical protein CARUB_v10015057mg [Capsella rubella]
MTGRHEHVHGGKQDDWQREHEHHRCCTSRQSQLHSRQCRRLNDKCHMLVPKCHSRCSLLSTL